MSANNVSNIKYWYFNGRARGEICRYILAYSGVAWEDRRVEFPEWGTVKPTLPMGVLPVLHFTDAEGHERTVTQSSAIARTLARWFGLDGKTDTEKSTVDEVVEALKDVVEAGVTLNWEFEPERKAKLQKRINTITGPNVLNFLEKTLKANGGRYIAGGESFTYADLAVAAVLDMLCDKIEIRGFGDLVAGREPVVESLEQLEATYPGLAALKRSVEAEANLASYLAKRPKCTY